MKTCETDAVNKILKRSPSKSFQDLIVWQKAHKLVLLIYKYSDKFPQKEIYGLTSQYRRAAISIPANIAEGYKKKSIAEKSRFMNISQDSLEECRYYLILANDLNYGKNDDIMTQPEEVSKLLNSYNKAIQNSSDSFVKQNNFFI